METKEVFPKLEFFDLFRELSLHFGSNEVCILDSAKGPDADRNCSIVGIFPKFDLTIRKGKVKIECKCEKLESQLSKLNLESPVFSDIFPQLQEIFQTGGLIGYFGYEYLHYLNNIKRENIADLNMPDVHLCFYSHLLIKNTKDNSVKLQSHFICDDAEEEKQKILKFISEKREVNREKREEVKAGKIENSMSKEEFLEKTKIALDYIAKGEIQQIILGNRKKVKTNAKAIDIYSEIRKENPSPYMFFWERADYSLIGNSPELQLKVEGQHAEIRPIGGTSKGKGRNATERQKLLDDMISSKKEQTEHIMLVDLAKDDIGVYAEKGSVKVDKFMFVEEYSNVFHLVSVVSGKLPKNCNSMKVFEASFPAGTLTGAPRVRACEIIQELEDYERGVYGGAFGFFDFNGDILSSIAIRTAIKIGDNVYFQSSAGIVASSNPEDEWNETEFKTNAIKSVIERV